MTHTIIYPNAKASTNRNNFLSGLKVRDEGARTC